MALFGIKKKNTKAKKSEKDTQQIRAEMSVVKKPRISEKAVLASDKNVYTYEVVESATKHSVRSHIISTFGKIPLKVNISSIPKKKRARKTKARVKKAHVTLRKGDSIDFLG